MVGTLPIALRNLSLLIFTAALAAACSSVVGETPVETTDDKPFPTAPPTTTTLPARECLKVTATSEPVDTGALATDALFLSGEQFVCADSVVVVGEGDLNLVSTAAQLAAALKGPLLFPHPLLPAELGRLTPFQVHLVGAVEVSVPPGVEVVSHSAHEATALASELLDGADIVMTPENAHTETVAETVLAIDHGGRLVLAESSSEVSPPPDVSAPALIERLSVSSPASRLWMVAASSPTHALLAAAAGRNVDATVVAVDANNLLAYPEISAALEGRDASSIRFIGTTPLVDSWHIDVLINGDQVPGGGFVILPDDRPRRYVAFYGHPVTSALGVLGEQGPVETLTRMEPFLTAYAGDGSQVVPVFEMIASVAAASATEDGDYSFEWPVSTFDDWVETARQNDVYIMLDLQPGRDDFLTQAKQYEEMLRLPFVGVALDPEWRLEPDQVHLNQVGRVSADEVNQVIHWLADLVRDNGLPQKMMIVHQFRTFMIQDRELLEERPEIQLVIQMDGDGTEAQKDNTYAALNVGAEDAFWAWGWKNFFDEDEPGPPTPESTMSKQPTPIYVSYQ